MFITFTSSQWLLTTDQHLITRLKQTYVHIQAVIISNGKSYINPGGSYTLATLQITMYVQFTTYVTVFWKTDGTLCLFHLLIATLIHYPRTVALSGLADWSAFLEWVCQLCKVTTETMGLWRALDGRYGSAIYPCVSDMSLRPSMLV